MNKNKKGFTIIELMAVIIIIGVLALTIIPAIRKYTSKGYDKYYKGLADQIEISAKDYYSDHKAELPSGKKEENGNKYAEKLDVNTLTNNNYLTNDVVDKKGNQCNESYILADFDYETSKHKYYVCIICGGEKVFGDEKYCLVDGIDKYAPVCKITHSLDVNKDTWVSKATLNFNITDDKSGVKKLATKDLTVSTLEQPLLSYQTTYDLPNGITDLSKLKFMAFDNQNHLSYCTNLTGTVKVDNELPTCSISKEVVGVNEIKLTVQSQDELSKVKTLTNLNNLEVYQDNTYKVTTAGTYKFEVTDNALNKNTCSITIKDTDFDNEKPNVTVTVTPGILASLNIKITDNIGVAGYQITNSSDTPSDYNKVDNLKEFTTTTNINNSGDYYIHAIDGSKNTSYQKITLVASSWSGYTQSNCDTATNPNTCLATSGYLKQTRSSYSCDCSSYKCDCKTTCSTSKVACGTYSCNCSDAWYYNGTYYPAKCSTCTKYCDKETCKESCSTCRSCDTCYSAWGSDTLTTSCSSGTKTKCTSTTLYQTRTLSCSTGCEAN